GAGGVRTASPAAFTLRAKTVSQKHLLFALSGRSGAGKPIEDSVAHGSNGGLPRLRDTLMVFRPERARDHCASATVASTATGSSLPAPSDAATDTSRASRHRVEHMQEMRDAMPAGRPRPGSAPGRIRWGTRQFMAKTH